MSLEDFVFISIELSVDWTNQIRLLTVTAYRENRDWNACQL